ncbi:YchJ family protein [Teredinibacter franksiae]|uniref:YchJ family protein n=1 Tax=Teredinibacter franksiae TaxID=2761453 RepID=UPI0016265A7F|nr:YchJ family metal-binding protein [Teredinibacter franksiae]
MDSTCPCGSGTAYAACCAPLHLAEVQPTGCTPEALMRSRFCAFVNGNVDYLIATLHPDFHTGDERKQVDHALSTHNWLSLRVLEASPAQGNSATVEFVAFCTTDSEQPQQLHEKSNFIFEASRWWYTNGEMLPAIKLQRNDLCWCGKGAKLKKCHGL